MYKYLKPILYGISTALTLVVLAAISLFAFITWGDVDKRSVELCNMTNKTIVVSLQAIEQMHTNAEATTVASFDDVALIKKTCKRLTYKSSTTGRFIVEYDNKRYEAQSHGKILTEKTHILILSENGPTLLKFSKQ